MFYFSPLDNLTISRFVRFTIFLVTVSSLQCAVYAGGLAGAGVETPTAFPPSAEEIESIEGTSKMVLTSTPLDQKRKFDGQSTVSVVKCHYDDAGFLSNIRLDRASDSIDQDFQTLWAVSSFPPLKPFGPFRALEPTMIICNAPGIVSGATEEQLIIRSSLSEHLQKASEGDAGRIYFTLIPGSFILVFPKDIKILDVCVKENIVSIPIDSFEKIRKSKSNEMNAKSGTQHLYSIATLLDEWPNFFKAKPHPNRNEIINFANHLKDNYKILFTPHATKDAGDQSQ